METYEIKAGMSRVVHGVRRDYTRVVRFEGEKIATHTRLIGNDDVRGVTET